MTLGDARTLNFQGIYGPLGQLTGTKKEFKVCVYIDT